ncbi:unnamed protein product [Microthlaspi erraticum]|uniref:MULE transposase domain-containing protein n=1 Tax=Microthlaspi erraticum TaxID=1685480 RepID=A0A6D2KTN3_9BRAS|nr:unnamed protein product [Microthlaspi erraticum]
MALMEWHDVPVLKDEYDSDGESRRERNDYELEKSIEEFEDEPRVQHDEYPDTESDEEEKEADENGEHEHGQRNPKRSEPKRGAGNLFEGYDKDRIAFHCGGKNCNWYVYCSISGKTSKWQVKVYRGKHICDVNGECEMLKVHVIARLFLHKIRDEPEYFMPMKIEELIKSCFRIVVTRAQCQTARNKALKWIRREYEDQFSRLRDYGAEILESNPDSSVDIDCIQNAEGLDVFNRFYVCFDIIRRKWKETCRPIIGVDGTFLKSTISGQLLVALGRDADNAIYPIAWGIVRVENTDNWLWFMNKIKVDLGLEDGDNYILVSDRQKGLISAAKKTLPKIEHRMCVRHIYGNLKAKHGKKPEMKGLVWQLAWSYNEADFRANLEQIKEWDFVVYQDIMKQKPETWCRAFYKIGNYCEDVENNSTESWNSTVSKAREDDCAYA